MRQTLLLILLVATPVFGADSDQEAFKRAYQNYQTALQESTARSVLLYAEQAYELGAKVYGDDSKTVASLQLNLANALIEAQASRTRTIQEARVALKKYRVLHGDTAVDLIDPLITMGNALNDSSERIDKYNYKKAINIAANHFGADSDVVGHIYMGIGKHLAQRAYFDSGNYFDKALAIYERNYGKGTIQTLEAHFWLGKLKTTKRKYQQAENHLQAVLTILDAREVENRSVYALASHAFLVEALERQNKSQEATKHCLAIGRLKPWSADEEQFPVFKKVPIYPKGLARNGKEASVLLEFRIDTQGFVVDSRVISIEGDTAFGETALETIAEWRYAPYFVDGKATVSPPIQHRLTYSFRDI